ncbi:hypothetical protein Tco_0522797 [Tanacetum coccineum]
MRTRSSSNLIVESSTTLKRRNRRRSKQRVEPFSLEETSVVTMADQRTMAELLQAPTEGYRDAIVIPAILAENFELKHGLLNLIAALADALRLCLLKIFSSSFRESKYRDNIQGYVSAAAMNYNQGNTGYRPQSLSLPELTPTQMILELADQSTTSPSVDDEAITFKVGQTSRYSYNDAESVNQIDVIDVRVRSMLKKIEDCLTNDSIPPGIDDADFDLEGDIHLLEELLNDDPSSPLPPKEFNFEELKTIKSSIDDPLELELKDLPSHLEYALRKLNDATRKDHFPLPFMDQMLERLTGNEYYFFLKDSWIFFKFLLTRKTKRRPPSLALMGRLPTYFCLFRLYGMLRERSKDHEAIFHYMIEETMEVFMDDFSVFGDYFSSCLSHLDKMPKRCEDTNLVLNWEKCHFMVKEGIVLGHKISKSRIEVDKAKVDVIAKLPHPTFVKGVRCFLGHARFSRASSKPVGSDHSPLLKFSLMVEDKAFNHGVLASKEKSPPSSSHRGFKASKLFHQKSPMLIYGEDIPILDVPFLHFYPP